MHKYLLWFIGALTVTGFFPGASASTSADLWWDLGETCQPAVDALRDEGVTEDNNTTGDSSIEYDPLKRTDCADLRDDLQREVYEQTGTPTAWGCNSIGTPWRTCVGLNLEDCDVWISALWWQCVGGVFPDNSPS